VFAGFRADVDRLVPAFPLLCLTSRTEGLGSSLLDATCFGRAVVATETGGIPEAVVNGRTGLLVPFGDPSALAPRGPETRSRVASRRRRARRSVEDEARAHDRRAAAELLPEAVAQNGDRLGARHVVARAEAAP
jgi:glycosyltransferase involved in cell wall biosynthesis